MIQPDRNRRLRIREMTLRIFLGGISLILTLSVCLAQSGGKKSGKKTPPDLSGTWTLDYSRSSLDPALKRQTLDYVLTIVHREPEIRITKKYKQSGSEKSEEIVYYTDGRAELTSRGGHPDPESITRWQGDKLVRRTTYGLDGVQTSPPLEVVRTEEWKLSLDGKNLTRTITNSGMVMSKVRYVFVRS